LWTPKVPQKTDLIAERKMTVDATQTAPLTTQVLQWLNGLTLPGIVIFVFGASRWLTKKEDELKGMLDGAKGEFELLKTNHLHHLQQSLDEIKGGQDKLTEAAERHQGNMVLAINSSKDAIVQAILITKQ
jgi:hypothetical protein